MADKDAAYITIALDADKHAEDIEWLIKQGYRIVLMPDEVADAEWDRWYDEAQAWHEDAVEWHKSVLKWYEELHSRARTELNNRTN